MTNKRKQNDLINEYDSLQLLRLYRWMRWERTHIIPLNASPQLARHKIDTLITRSRHFHSVQTQETPYEFRVFLPEHLGEGIVIGRVITEADGTSAVILRTYPGSINIGCTTLFTGIMLFLVGGPLSIVLHSDGLDTRVFICLIILSIIMLGLVALIWASVFGQRNRAFDFMINVLAPLAHQDPQKAKR